MKRVGQRTHKAVHYNDGAESTKALLQMFQASVST